MTDPEAQLKPELSDIARLREKSRQTYLGKRRDEKAKELKDDIDDDIFLFEDQP